MTNTEVIYSAIKKSGLETNEQKLEETTGNCMLCGKEILSGTKFKKIVSANFTDYDVFQNVFTKKE